MPFIEVAFNLPLDHTFTYFAPEQFNITKGMRVYVPFGNRTVTGIIVSTKRESSLSNVKNIIDVLDEQPLISVKMLRLTSWIADYYMCSWGQALQLALPKGLDIQEKENLFVSEEDPEIQLSDRQRELYFLIANNPGKDKSYYRKKMGASSFHSVLSSLVNKGLVFSEQEKQKARVGTLLKKFVHIPTDYFQSKKQFPDFLKYVDKRQDVDDYLTANSGKQVLLADFIRDTNMARATLQKMAGLGVVSIADLAVERKHEIFYQEKQPDIHLTSEQKHVIETLIPFVNKAVFQSVLLHGITGSGKTIVYIEILRAVLKKGRSAIILIPEIALTPQTVSRFENAFENQIAVFHSKMSAGQRYDAWMACYKDQVKIAIGPRSALFAPLQNIGLIVVDEEHESSYKQTDSAPTYNARDVALYWGKMNDALVMLGSATPSFESYSNAVNKKHILLEIKNRAVSKSMPQIFLADMCYQRRESGRPVFSKLLIEKMRQRLELNEQIILLQNRRGYASFQQCRHCGFIIQCTDCEVALTYHSYDNKLRCHYCGITIPAPFQCPNCGSEDLHNKGIGTQRIQDELLNLFPECKVLRMDQDTTRGKNAYDQILNAFRDKQASILLGTQMISKGLDFPNVTLVGVITADVGLGIPDFRASERVFQLLAQVSGRSGRGHKQGEVVVQTFQPAHYAIRFARAHDFIGFYNQEITHRKNFDYPPFTRIIQITVSSMDISMAISVSRSVALAIRKSAGNQAMVIGPAPALLAKLKNLYRWQVTIKFNPALGSAMHLKSEIRKIIKPYFQKKNQNLYVNVDVDPLLSF